MEVIEILLLIIGICIFLFSFLVPVKENADMKQTKELAKEEVKELVAGQMQEIRQQVDDTVEEAVAYAMEKTERSLERISNEKIMAVSEYSDTVLAEIHKNHQEVMFLYDMLNDKHDKLKDTAVEVEKKAKETLQKVKDAEGRIQKIEVVSGFSDGNNVEIKEGLSEGDVVLIESKVKSE